MEDRKKIERDKLDGPEKLPGPPLTGKDLFGPGSRARELMRTVAIIKERLKGDRNVF